jgi:hypothetical protein
MSYFLLHGLKKYPRSGLLKPHRRLGLGPRAIPLNFVPIAQPLHTFVDPIWSQATMSNSMQNHVAHLLLCGHFIIIQATQVYICELFESLWSPWWAKSQRTYGTIIRTTSALKTYILFTCHFLFIWKVNSNCSIHMSKLIIEEEVLWNFHKYWMLGRPCCLYIFEILNKILRPKV